MVTLGSYILRNIIPMKNFIYLFFSLLLFLSCDDRKENSNQEKDNQSHVLTSQSSEGYELLKNQCYACHSPVSSSHDVIIAPPMAAVKMRYSRRFDSKDEFVDAMVSWTMNPEKEKALMRGAVDKFELMPKQAFKEEDMLKIASYIYENKLEEPSWFAAHQKEMHGNANGMRQGMIK